MEPTTFAYGDHPSQELDIYLPEEINTDTNIFIYYHGGGWRIGDKASEQTLRIATVASNSLYDPDNTILVSVGYRKTGEPTLEHPHNSPDITQQDILDDSVAAYNLAIQLAEENGVSTDNLSIGGVSAGGWIVGNILTNPELVGDTYHSIDNFVIGSGVYDQSPYFELTEGDYDWVTNPGLRDWYLEFVDNTFPTDTNPQSNIQDITTTGNVIMYHGENDTLTPIGQSDTFYASLQELGINVEYTRLDDSGHNLEELNIIEDINNMTLIIQIVLMLLAEME